MKLVQLPPSVITDAAHTWKKAQVFSGGISATGDFALDGDLDFTGPQAITTTSGDLTVSPAVSVIFGTEIHLSGPDAAPNASADEVRFGITDYTTADARFIIASEAGAAISVGNNQILFTGSTDSVAVANEVSLGGFEISATNRVLAISQEKAVATEVAADSTHTLTVQINGATYRIMLTNA